MKHLQKILVLFLVLTMLLSVFPVYAAEHWATEYLQYAAANGLWYESKITEPDKAITRSELAFMAATTIEMPNLSKELDLFDDVKPDNPHYYDILALNLEMVWCFGRMTH